MLALHSRFTGTKITCLLQRFENVQNIFKRKLGGVRLHAVQVLVGSWYVMERTFWMFSGFLDIIIQILQVLNFILFWAGIQITFPAFHTSWSSYLNFHEDYQLMLFSVSVWYNIRSTPSNLILKTTETLKKGFQQRYSRHLVSIVPEENLCQRYVF